MSGASRTAAADQIDELATWLADASCSVSPGALQERLLGVCATLREAQSGVVGGSPRQAASQTPQVGCMETQAVLDKIDGLTQRASEAWGSAEMELLQRLSDQLRARDSSQSQTAASGSPGTLSGSGHESSRPESPVLTGSSPTAASMDHLVQWSGDVHSTIGGDSQQLELWETDAAASFGNPEQRFSLVEQPGRSVGDKAPFSFLGEPTQFARPPLKAGVLPALPKTQAAADFETASGHVDAQPSVDVFTQLAELGISEAALDHVHPDLPPHQQAIGWHALLASLTPSVCNDFLECGLLSSLLMIVRTHLRSGHHAAVDLSVLSGVAAATLVLKGDVRLLSKHLMDRDLQLISWCLVLALLACGVQRIPTNHCWPPPTTQAGLQVVSVAADLFGFQPRENTPLDADGLLVVLRGFQSLMDIALSRHRVRGGAAREVPAGPEAAAAVSSRHSSYFARFIDSAVPALCAVGQDLVDCLDQTESHAGDSLHGPAAHPSQARLGTASSLLGAVARQRALTSALGALADAAASPASHSLLLDGDIIHTAVRVTRLACLSQDMVVEITRLLWKWTLHPSKSYDAGSQSSSDPLALWNQLISILLSSDLLPALLEHVTMLRVSWCLAQLEVDSIGGGCALSPAVYVADESHLRDLGFRDTVVPTSHRFLRCAVQSAMVRGLSDTDAIPAQDVERIVVRSALQVSNPAISPQDSVGVPESGIPSWFFQAETSTDSENCAGFWWWRLQRVLRSCMGGVAPGGVLIPHMWLGNPYSANSSAAVPFLLGTVENALRSRTAAPTILHLLQERQDTAIRLAGLLKDCISRKWHDCMASSDAARVLEVLAGRHHSAYLSERVALQEAVQPQSKVCIFDSSFFARSWIKLCSDSLQDESFLPSVRILAALLQHLRTGRDGSPPHTQWLLSSAAALECCLGHLSPHVFLPAWSAAAIVCRRFPAHALWCSGASATGSAVLQCQRGFLIQPFADKDRLGGHGSDAGQARDSALQTVLDSVAGDMPAGDQVQVCELATPQLQDVVLRYLTTRHPSGRIDVKGVFFSPFGAAVFPASSVRSFLRAHAASDTPVAFHCLLSSPRLCTQLSPIQALKQGGLSEWDSFVPVAAAQPYTPSSGPLVVAHGVVLDSMHMHADSTDASDASGASGMSSSDMEDDERTPHKLQQPASSFRSLALSASRGDAYRLSYHEWAFGLSEAALLESQLHIASCLAAEMRMHRECAALQLRAALIPIPPNAGSPFPSAAWLTTAIRLSCCPNIEVARFATTALAQSVQNARFHSLCLGTMPAEWSWRLPRELGVLDGPGGAAPSSQPGFASLLHRGHMLPVARSISAALKALRPPSGSFLALPARSLKDLLHEAPELTFEPPPELAVLLQRWLVSNGVPFLSSGLVHEGEGLPQVSVPSPESLATVYQIGLVPLFLALLDSKHEPIRQQALVGLLGYAGVWVPHSCFASNGELEALQPERVLRVVRSQLQQSKRTMDRSTMCINMVLCRCLLPHLSRWMAEDAPGARAVTETEATHDQSLFTTFAQALMECIEAAVFGTLFRTFMPGRARVSPIIPSVAVAGVAQAFHEWAAGAVLPSVAAPWIQPIFAASAMNNAPGVFAPRDYAAQPPRARPTPFLALAQFFDATRGSALPQQEDPSGFPLSLLEQVALSVALSEGHSFSWQSTPEVAVGAAHLALASSAGSFSGVQALNSLLEHWFTCKDTGFHGQYLLGDHAPGISVEWKEAWEQCLAGAAEEVLGACPHFSDVPMHALFSDRATAEVLLADSPANLQDLLRVCGGPEELESQAGQEWAAHLALAVSLLHHNVSGFDQSEPCPAHSEVQGLRRFITGSPLRRPLAGGQPPVTSLEIVKTAREVFIRATQLLGTGSTVDETCAGPPSTVRGSSRIPDPPTWQDAEALKGHQPSLVDAELASVLCQGFWSATLMFFLRRLCPSRLVQRMLFPRVPASVGAAAPLLVLPLPATSFDCHVVLAACRFPARPMRGSQHTWDFHAVDVYERVRVWQALLDQTSCFQGFLLENPRRFVAEPGFVQNVLAPRLFEERFLRQCFVAVTLVDPAYHVGVPPRVRLPPASSHTDPASDMAPAGRPRTGTDFTEPAPGLPVLSHSRSFEESMHALPQVVALCLSPFCGALCLDGIAGGAQPSSAICRLLEGSWERAAAAVRTVFLQVLLLANVSTGAQGCASATPEVAEFARRLCQALSQPIPSPRTNGSIASGLTGLHCLSLRNLNLQADQEGFEAFLHLLSHGAVHEFSLVDAPTVSAPGLSQQVALQGIAEVLDTLDRLASASCDGTAAARLGALDSFTEVELASPVGMHTRRRVRFLENVTSGCDICIHNQVNAASEGLPSSLNCLTVSLALTRLDLSGCMLGDTGCAAILKAVATSGRLQCLDLSRNAVGAGLLTLRELTCSTGLLGMTTFKALHMALNSLEDAFIVGLCDFLSSSCLQVLKPAAAAWRAHTSAQALSGLPQLSVLDLAANGIASWSASRALLEVIRTNPKLLEIDLSNNLLPAGFLPALQSALHASPGTLWFCHVAGNSSLHMMELPGVLSILAGNRQRHQAAASDAASSKATDLADPTRLLAAQTPTAVLGTKPGPSACAVPRETQQSVGFSSSTTVGVSEPTSPALQAAAGALPPATIKNPLSTGDVHAHLVDAHHVIIGLFASPLVLKPSSRHVIELAQLGISAERAAVHAGLSKAARLIRFKAHFMTMETLQHALHSGATVLHLCCHADASRMALENAHGEAHMVGKSDLDKLLLPLKGSHDTSAHRPSLVYLAACSSEWIGDALAGAGIQHVVCIQNGKKVSDEASLRFSTAFYAALASGWPVAASFEAGRQSVRLNMKSAGEAEASLFMLLPHEDQAPSGCHHSCLFKDTPKLSLGASWAVLSRQWSLREQQQQCLLPEPVQYLAGGLSDLGEPTFSKLTEALPALPRAFGGRNISTQAVLSLLAQSRLVSVVGEAGVGKSALAAAVAHACALRQVFHDGVFFVPLAGAVTKSIARTRLAQHMIDASASISDGTELRGGLTGASIEWTTNPSIVQLHSAAHERRRRRKRRRQRHGPRATSPGPRGAGPSPPPRPSERRQSVPAAREEQPGTKWMSSRSIHRMIKGIFRSARALIVLDDAHDAPPAWLERCLVDILTACHGVHFLCTSRAPVLQAWFSREAAEVQLSTDDGKMPHTKDKAMAEGETLYSLGGLPPQAAGRLLGKRLGAKLVKHHGISFEHAQRMAAAVGGHPGRILQLAEDMIKRDSDRDAVTPTAAAAPHPPQPSPTRPLLAQPECQKPEGE